MKKMKQRKIFGRNSLIILGLFLVAMSQSCHMKNNPDNPKPPNFVVLFVDDLGYYNVGFRNKDYFTPNIDRLYSEGVTFSNAYVPNPSCSASRAALYTGQDPAKLSFFRHITGNVKHEKEFNTAKHDSAYLLSRNWLPLEARTYAEVLKNVGYRTFFVGKWHLGYGDYVPENQGFDSAWTKPDAGSTKSYYPPYFPGEGFWNDIPDSMYLTDFYTDKAVEYLKNYNSDKPFLLQFSYQNVHTPNVGRKDLIERYQKIGFEKRLANYGAQVSAVDESIGRILKVLKEKGLEKNTIIIFASDQGSFFPNTPLRGTKASALYEGGQKIPFIIKWPGVFPEGSDEPTHVQTTDIFPTICEIVGQNPLQYQGIDGMSLLQLVSNKKPLNRYAIFSQQSYDEQFATVLDTNNWKLISWRDGSAELYKVDEDIAEENNVAEQFPEITQKLSQTLFDWEEKMGIFKLKEWKFPDEWKKKDN